MTITDHRRRLGLAGLGFAAAALIAAGCGSGDEGGSADGSAATAQPAPKIKGLAPALAANRAEANQLLEGGTATLERKLDELEGHPVIVNQWASWCPPCRAEFPFFADAAGSHAKAIAFLGIDMEDTRSAAEDFLAENPVPYPSVIDPDRSAIASLGGGFVSPTTVFIEASGEIVHVFEGTYTSRDQLEEDIDEHLPTRGGKS